MCGIIWQADCLAMRRQFQQLKLRRTATNTLYSMNIFVLAKLHHEKTCYVAECVRGLINRTWQPC